MDRVTGQEVEFHLGLWHARQDGQAILWVALTMILIVGLFAAGTGIAQLMIFRWDAQGAADAAALAGANIQAQAIMSIQFVGALIYARNAVKDLMYVALGVLTGLCLTGNLAACAAALSLAGAIKSYIGATATAVEIAEGIQTFIRVVFPFYASANATWFGWKNGALAVGIPLPLLKPGEGAEPGNGAEPDGDFETLSDQAEAISNCMQWMMKPIADIVDLLDKGAVKDSIYRLQQAVRDDDVGAMRAELIRLDSSSLRGALQRLVAAIDRAKGGAGGCDLGELGEVIAAGFDCGITVTCEETPKTVCWEYSQPRGPSDLANKVNELRKAAIDFIGALDSIGGCLTEEDDEDCIKSISGQIVDYQGLVKGRARTIEILTKRRSKQLQDCLECMARERHEDEICRFDKGISELLGLQGIFVVVWRRPSQPQSLLDLDSKLWRTGQSLGAVYASAFGTPRRVEDSAGKCRRCLFQSVSLGVLDESPLRVLVDILVEFFNELLGSEDCPEPEGWDTGGILNWILQLIRKAVGLIGDIIAWIAGLFGDKRPDLCERRPALIRVDAGLTMYLGLAGSRGQFNEFIATLIEKYNEVANAWNGVPESIGTWGIWDLFPDISELLRGLRLKPITEPDLTGGLF